MGSSFRRMWAHGSFRSSDLVKEKLRTTGCHDMLAWAVIASAADSHKISSHQVNLPECLLVMTQFDLIMVLDEVETLALDRFIVDPGSYLGLEVLDCDGRSAPEAELQ